MAKKTKAKKISKKTKKTSKKTKRKITKKRKKTNNFLVFLITIVVIVGVVIISKIKSGGGIKYLNAERIYEWGKKGAGKGDINGPRGIAISPDSHLYVADYGNHRIVKYSLDGKFITVWGKKGKDKGEFNEPSGVAVDRENNVYVADAWNSRIQKFDKNGKYILEIGGPKAGFYSPRNVAVNKFGILYVADTGTSRVHRFDTKGNRIGNPVGGVGKELGKFNEVFGIAFDSKDNVYVADCKNGRIVILTSDLRPVYQKKVESWQENRPLWPMLGIDSKDNLYAVSSSTQEIIVYKIENKNTKIPKLKYIGTIKNDTSGKPLFTEPIGIAIDKMDILYISDTAANKIIKLRPIFN